MKRSLLITVTGVLLAIVSGCVDPVYDTLPMLPEYPELTESFDTSAFIEFREDADPALNAVMLEFLQKNGYKQILPELRFQFHDLAKTRVVQILVLDYKNYSCEDGRYLECFVAVMVRAPGEVWNGVLRYAAPRYFQAYSRKLLDEETAETDVRKELYREAMENIFKIAEFRQALEPLAEKTDKFSGAALSADEFWQKSGAEQKLAGGSNALAAYWAYIAADKGSKEADNYLLLNALSAGALRFSTVLELVKRHAQEGNNIAINELGYMYLNGIGIETDYVKALELFQKAAGAGNASAMFNIGCCYENGYGVPRNRVIARKWFAKAAELGLDIAVRKLQTVR